MIPLKIEAGSILELHDQLYTVEQRLGAEIELRNAAGKAAYVTDDHLREAWVRGKLILQPKSLKDAAGPLARHTDSQNQTLSEAEREKMLRYWEFGSAMHNAGMTTKLNAITRLEIAAEVCRQHGWTAPLPSAATLYRIASTWAKTNGAALALAPHNKDKGNRKPRISDEVAAIIDEQITATFMSPQRLTYADVWNDIKEVILSINRSRAANVALSMPSYATVRDRIRQKDQYKLTKARHGERVARTKHGIFGPGREANRVNEIWQMDHTVLNILVVDTESKVIIGQPYITVAIDQYSRCVTGFYITFEPPSFLSVARCLEHAISPKTYVATTHPDVINAWPCHGTPERILVDNGAEFHSASLTHACALLGIHIDYAGRKAPWTKGIIERMMKIVNHSFTHKIRGTTFSNYLDRGDYDASKEAVVPYDVLIKAFHKFVIDVLLRDVHKGIRDIPVLRWATGAQEWPVLLPPRREDLRFLLSKQIGPRQLQHYGIDCLGLRYYSPDLIKIRSLPGDQHTVDVSYNPTDIGWIYVNHPSLETPLKVPCNAQRYAAGLSEWAHKVIRNHTSNTLKKETSEYELLSTKTQIGEMIEAAFARKSIKGKKKMARMMKKETSELHGITPIQPADPPSPLAPPSAPKDDDDDLDLSEFNATFTMPKRDPE